MIFHTFLVYLQTLLQSYGTNQCIDMHWVKHKCSASPSNPWWSTGTLNASLKYFGTFVLIPILLPSHYSLSQHIQLNLSRYWYVSSPKTSGTWSWQDFHDKSYSIYMLDLWGLQLNTQVLLCSLAQWPSPWSILLIRTITNSLSKNYFWQWSPIKRRRPFLLWKIFYSVWTEVPF